MIRPGDFVVHETTGEVKLVIEVSQATSELLFSGSPKWTRTQGWKPTGKNVLPDSKSFGPYFSDHATYMATKWAVRAGKASWIGYLHPSDPILKTVPCGGVGPNKVDHGFRFGTFNAEGCPQVIQFWPVAPPEVIDIVRGPSQEK